MKSSHRSTSSTYILAISALLASAVVHSDALSYQFSLDDYLHLYQAANTGFLEFVMTPHGFHLYQTRNAIFYLLYKLFGVRADCYLAVVLANHLLNVFLLFQVIRNLTSRPLLAAFGAAMWGMSPVNRGCLGWYSAHGAVLVVTWLLWILYDLSLVSRGSGTGEPITRLRLAKWYLLLLAAATSYGAGFGIAMFFGFVLWFFLGAGAQRSKVAAVILPLLVLLPLVGLGVQRLHEMLSGGLGEPGGGLYALGERVVLDPWFWLGALKMWVVMIAYGVSSLVFGALMAIGVGGIGVGPLRGVGARAVLLVSVCSLAVFAGWLIWTLFGAARAKRDQVAALGVMVGLAYGSIAVGRWGMYSVLGYSVHQVFTVPRYHYIGPAFVAVMLCLLLSEVRIGKLIRGWKIPALALVFWMIAAVGLDRQAARRMMFTDASEQELEYAREISNIREQIAGSPERSEVYIENTRLRFIRVWGGTVVFPHKAALFVMTFPENRVRDRRVFFIERDRDAVRELRRRSDTRISSLIVSPEEVPRAYFKTPPWAQ